MRGVLHQLPAEGQAAAAPISAPYVVTCNGLAYASVGFWATTPPAYATAATRQSTTPSTEVLPPPAIDSPTTTAPAKDTAMPVSSRGARLSPSRRKASSAISSGAMFTTRDAVPASTNCSPQLRTTE